MTRLFFTVGPEHVGRAFVKAFGRVWPVSDFLGVVLASDKGKRVYRVRDNAGGHYLQAENDEQRDRRIALTENHP
jgi:hypothetical protein